MNIIFFSGSFAVLCFLVILKVFDMKVRKIGFLTRFFGVGDRLIDGTIQGAIVRYNYYKKVSQIFLFDFLPSLLYEVLVKMKDSVARRYYNAGNEFRGRRLLRNDGSVSSFLERLSEDK
jgi:hypothetical protein